MRLVLPVPVRREYACGDYDEGLEIDSRAYNDGEDANLGHIEMCRKYAQIVGRAARVER